MAMMDDMQNKMGDMDNMKDRFEELKNKEQAGQLDAEGRVELAKLRSRFENK